MNARPEHYLFIRGEARMGTPAREACQRRLGFTFEGGARGVGRHWRLSGEVSSFWDDTASLPQLAALARFGNPDLVKVLNETGLGNHKAVIRFMAQVGKQISEDRLPGTGDGASTGEPVDPAALMYPSMQTK